MRGHSYYKKIRQSGEYLPSCPDDSLESIEDTAPTFDLFVLLGHLWVVAGGEVTSDLEHFKEVLLEVRDDLGSTVADYTIKKAMMPTYFMHDSFGGFFTGHFLSTRQEMGHLRISIHYC